MRGLLVAAVLLTLAVVGVQQFLHGHLEEAVPVHPFLHWVRDSLLALPFGLVAALVWRRRSDRRDPSPHVTDALSSALGAGAVFAVLSVPGGMAHGRVFGAEHVHGSFVRHALSDAVVVWFVASVVLLALGRLAAPARWSTTQRLVAPRRALRPVAVALALILAAPVAVVAVPPAGLAGADTGCERSYDVAAIDLDIPYNRWGQIDADGMMYVLQQDKAAVKNWDVPLNHVRAADGTYQPGTDPAGGRRLRPRPLILRANEGDCVKVTLTNELTGAQFGGELVNPRVSMHIHGAAYQVNASDGSEVGFNDDTTVGIGESITYEWVAPEEGVYLFHDHGAIAGSEGDGGATVHGLFGALAVEPAGSQWTDPVSGARLDGPTPYTAVSGQSGDLYIDADIHPPSGRSFRESVQLSHDEIPGIGFGFNYGSEPGAERERAALCPDCVGEETSLSSWPYGDPALVKLASGKGPWLPAPTGTNVEDCGLVGSCWASNVTHAYRWDPTKIRYGLAGVKETHVFHMHAHQWLAEPKDVGSSGSTPGAPSDTNRPESMTIDSQTFGPGDMFTADLLFGAGSKPGTVGDSIFHCHLYPHFAEGFWALFRVHDVREDGTGTTPDGIGVRNLQPLPGGVNPPAPTPENPGFPRFIPGKFGWRAPQPYGGITNPDDPAKPATRMVAGQQLDQSVLDATQRITSTSTATSEVQTVTNSSDRVNETQHVAVTATGGTFTLGFAGQTTDELAHDVTATDLEGALDALTSIGDVTVSSPSTGGWDVTFLDPGGQNVDPLVATNVSLVVDDVTTVPAGVTVSTTTDGADGGTFTLTRDAGAASAVTTAPIAFDATAAQVQDALVATGVTVTVGKDTTSNTWHVTFEPGADPAELVADSTALSSGTASVTTTTPGSVTDPTFTLTFGDETTGAIAAGATAADVEAALELLDNVVDVAVTGAGTSADPWTVKLGLWNLPTPSLLLTATGATVDADAVLSATPGDVGHQLMVERHALLRANNPGYDPAAPGTGLVEPKPGAPMSDPCVGAKREITYDVSVIQRDVVYNEAGWHDTQGRMLVLDKDVDAVLAGTKEPEPLFVRVSAGDCINFNLTNRLPNWFGNDAFVKLAQTNMVGQHIHLLKFDVIGSDGSSNGWNYQQAAFSQLQREFNDRVAAGTQSCTPSICRLPLPANYDPSWTGQQSGQTLKARWFADYELRTVFTHDHHFPALDQNRGLYGALLVEPQGTDYRHPRTGEVFVPSASRCATGATCVGDAAGPMMDIIGPGSNDDFREFGLSFQDFVSLTRPGGDPTLASDVFNPPDAPEVYPDDDPGVMGINYRNAPFLLRDTKNGVWVDPAYRFSSTVFGDPQTPLLQAYAKDKVRIRLVGGSQEEQHVFALHGMRWRDEPDDPQSPITGSRALGVSDALNFEIPSMECGVDEDCRGDYLYSSTSTDATYLGMWGIMRVYGKGTKQLLALPDNQPQAVNGSVNFAVTGEPPPKANKPGTPCAATDPVRAFHVIATDGRITYNAQGDHDPYGLMYGLVEPGETPGQAADRVRAKPQPLVLRANEGDCLEVQLTNQIDPTGPFARDHAPKGAAPNDPHGGDPSLPLEGPSGTRAGLRVSLHPQVLLYDVRGSDGATVGFNRDQTVGPGESIRYRWSVPAVDPGEIGATNLVDFGDVRGHRHHGLFAGLNIQPRGASYHDPFSGAEVRSGASADIRVAKAPDFREFTVFFQDGLNLRDAGGAFIEAPLHDGEPFDSEDEGEKGFNYATEPFRHRIGEPVNATQSSPFDGQALARVFSSKVHGDPSTPIFRAHAGDPVRMRVLQGSDKPRQHSFQQSGHSWMAQPDDPGSTLVGTQGGISVSRAVNVHLASAGGGVPGDYRYNCGVYFHHQSGGLWGITRVYAKPAAAKVFEPTALTSLDDPRAPGNSPIMPLEQATIRAHVFDDTNMNQAQGADERSLDGVDVKLVERSPGADGQLYTSDDTVTELDRQATGQDGSAQFSAAPGVYDVEPVVAADWAGTTPSSVRVDVSGDSDASSTSFGLVQLADVTLRAFHDKSTPSNGTLDTGEPPLGGWKVTLSGDGTTKTGTTDSNGQATFDGLLPGTYAADAVPPAGWYNTSSVPVVVEVTENASLNPGDGTDVRLGYALKAGLSVSIFNDSDGDGAQGENESDLAGWEVTATGGPPGVTVTARGTTDARGVVTFDDPDPSVSGLRPGTYVITPTYPKDWRYDSATAMATSGTATSAVPAFSCAGGSCTTVLAEDTTQVVDIASRNPNVWAVAAPFNDANNDGRRQEKESKLVGWQAELFAADGTTPVVPTGWTTNKTVTGANGLAVFYPLPPGTYTLKMVAPPPSPDPQVIDWTGTTSSRVEATVIAGETGRAPFGFARLGTVSATVFNDQDKDGAYEDEETLLANRNVRLYDKTGRTLLKKGVTDASGTFAFKATPGTGYQLEVLVPAGWEPTTPKSSNGSVLTKVKVTGPSDTQGVDVLFGHYEQHDTTPPPDPVADPPGGTYSSAQAVSLTSEAGATIRYTLDGSTPTATAGQLYAEPISITTTKTLQAIAIDAAGNTSAVTSHTYTISTSSTGATTAAPAPPSSWTVLKGSVSSGSVANLATDDSSYLVMKSTKAGKKQVVDGYGSYTVPQSQRNMSALTVVYDGGASTGPLSRTLSLYDFTTAAWETIRAEEQTAADQKATIDLSGDPKRFLSSGGEIRMRVAATHSTTYDLKADVMTFTVTYR